VRRHQHHAGICAVLGDVPERGERAEHHRQSRRRDQPFRVLQQVHRKFTLTFSDNNGQHFTRTRACPAGATCRRNSAEAISEAPAEVVGSTVTILPLANFGTARFANVSITNTSGTHRGGLRSSFWNTLRITQVAGDGTNVIAGTRLWEPSSTAQLPCLTQLQRPVAGANGEQVSPADSGGRAHGPATFTSMWARARPTSTGSHP
jgi:hypothetical protein